MLDRARQTVAAGVSSRTRGVKAGWYPEPLFIDHAEGAYLFDVDGNQYIDYMCGQGPLILGHRPQPVIDAVVQTLQERGTMFGLSYDLEYEAAEKITEHIPSMQKIKFSNTGSEACHYAVRLARAVTGKNKILKFEGHFHGWMDVVYFSYHPPIAQAGPQSAPCTIAESTGIPEQSNDLVIVAPWNDADALAALIERHKDELAAVIAEPVMGNCGVIAPQPGYLEAVRELTRANGILLIFDEIITGFRCALGGAQSVLQVIPDITVIAKAMGAGFPVSAYGGSDEVMQTLIDEAMPHGGTYNSNLMAIAAVKATITELERPGFYEQLIGNTTLLADGVRAIFTDMGIPVFIHQFGAHFTPIFATRDVYNYREFVQHASQPAYTALHRALIERGVLIYPSHKTRWYVSAAHSTADIQNTLDRVYDSVAEIKAAL